MMKIMKFMFILFVSLAIGACDSDDDNNTNNGNNGNNSENTNGGGNNNGGDNGDNGNGGNDTPTAYTQTALSEAPVWQIDWNNDQESPNWTEPDGTFYENWTILRVQIEDELQPYVSADDLMAVFVNGELRGLASPATSLSGEQTGKEKFIIKVWGNETETETVNISLQYYNKKLKHLFTLSDNITLDSDQTTGIDEVYIPQFTYGSPKYPEVKTVSVESLLTKVGITPTQDNMVSAFVGDECRGIATLSAGGNTSLVIYGRKAGESVTLKYYDAADGILYTIADAVKM